MSNFFLRYWDAQIGDLISICPEAEEIGVIGVNVKVALLSFDSPTNWLFVVIDASIVFTSILYAFFSIMKDSVSESELSSPVVSSYS